MPHLAPLRQHPLRQQLNDEVHSRPPADVVAPMMVTQIAVTTGETGADEERALLRELARDIGAAVPDAFGNHLALEADGLRVVWERHTEFSTYAVSRPCPLPGGPGADLAAPFASPPIAALPAGWRARLPGEVIAGINLLVLDADPEEAETRMATAFPGSKIIGSGVAGGRAAAWTDFRLHPDGLSRIVVAAGTLTPGRLGRLVQRLLDIETYRMMALLAFPLARRLTPELGAIEDELAELAAANPRIETLADEQALLGRLSRLAARAEDLATRSQYRFSAARAYHQLVERRISELDEVKRSGMQQIGTFLERRLGPAMRTCQAVADRLEALSARIARASSLLNTRVELALQEQNQSLLASMERRVRLQTRLQETVEGLSAVAISYYLVGLIAYVLKAMEKSGQPVNPTLATGLLAPVILAAAYVGVRQIRKRVTGDETGSTREGGP